jgi:hypothetical protein
VGDRLGGRRPLEQPAQPSGKRRGGTVAGRGTRE